jgi:DNA ligase-1
MKAFAELFAALDETTSSSARLTALVAYLRATPDEDAAWAVYMLAGGKPRQLVPTAVLKRTAREAAGLPEWLFDECYAAVGDLAECIALVLPPPADTAPGLSAGADLADGFGSASAPATADASGLAALMSKELLPLRGLAPETQTQRLQALWARLPEPSRIVVNKLITGNLRVGVSRQLVTRALAEASGLETALIAQRLMSYTSPGRCPSAADLLAVRSSQPKASRGGAPYPFFLAQPWANALEAEGFRAHGPVADWQAEWKWDGIRAQLVCRDGQAWLWSRGEELITGQFPELEALGCALPQGTVLDGEVLAWQGERVLAFARLQKRLGRSGPPSAALQRATPVVFMAYDCLEAGGEDLRQRPLTERRAQLEAIGLLARVVSVGELVDAPTLRLSPLIEAASWPELAERRASARERGVEGLMLKACSSRYGVGRSREAGLWWKWKLAPYTVDAVLTYAQAGHGRRANLFTDYTFGVWTHSPREGSSNASESAEPGTRAESSPPALITIAKAYSGLTDAEIVEVDRYVRQHSLEKFGPVRAVQPELVFELAFEGIAASPRHKSGLALRFPRILRWRRDKKSAEADSLESLRRLIESG